MSSLTSFRPVRPFLILLVAIGLSGIARGTTVAPPDFAELVKESDYVVRAVVKSVTPVEKAAAPGRRPMIFSEIELDVKQVITGRPPDHVVLEVLGGKLGNKEMYISGAPRFEVGQESIFFVQGNGAQIFPLVRMMHGLYPVMKDIGTGKEYVARSNGKPMENVAEVQQAMHAANLSPAERSQLAASALTPESFATQIRATAAALKADAK